MAQPFISGPPGSAAFAYFSSAGSKLLKTGPGSLRAVSIGVPATAAQVKLFDGVDDTGTLIATVDAGEGRDIDFSAQFNVGLYVQVTGGNPNLTITFF
ncbi:hypothetical protein [Paraburkholderia caffeinilytica]|uniref:hypothetical protein n=1 Tax=Paraburkholderia caffeinilytica TaxID=1761016 RepID=UPI0038BD0931